ncbi:MAG: hypothetical protein HC875_12845 [Anaerolineales bacterium]|nr:hypothetical protein [Anaerolineales bacterium]
MAAGPSFQPLSLAGLVAGVVGECRALMVGIPTITMLVNQPTMPLVNAVQITLAALIGLGVALLPGRLAAKQPAFFACWLLTAWP